MLLRDKLLSQGDWLFRWRSYVPLAMAPVLAVAVIRQGRLVDTSLGGVFVAAALIAALAGVAIRAYSIGHSAPGTSGGNTNSQVASDLTTTGLYSLVRHPLYLGNFLMWLGVAFFTRDILAVATLALFFGFYYERIMIAEERFLEDAFRERFLEWAGRTPAFVPRLSGFVPPTRRFQWRAVVKRDYGAWFAVVALFFAISAGEDSVAAGHIRVNVFWTIVYGLALTAYVAALYVKVRTSLLDPPPD